MYRVLKVSSFSYNSYQAFQPNLSFLHGKNLKCTLCNKIGRRQIIGGNVFECTTSHYSTSISTNPSISNPNKRRKNLKRSKYIELLEVSKNRTSERKARVKTLNARSWSKLHELESIDNQPAIETIPEVEHDFDGKTIEIFENQESVETLKELQNEPKKKLKSCSVYSNLSKKNKEKLTRSKLLDLDSSGREKSFNSSLVSYVELCMNCGFLNRGWYTVLYYLKNNKKLFIKDDRVFNILMECCAKNGNIDRLMEIWKTMVETANIKPSAVSFARRFETIVRSKKKDKAHLLTSTMRLMRDEGISCNDIFEQTKWKLDSREVVLSAIRAVQPQFTPKVKMPDTEYNCTLINHLNEKPEKLVSPAESIFSVEQLNNLYKEQLEMEKKTIVRVQSIEKPQLEKDTLFCRNTVERLEKEWEKAISAGFHKDLVNMANLQQKLYRFQSPINIYPYLTVLDKADYVEIIKQEVRKLASGSETYSSTVSRLCRALGNMVKLRYDIKCQSTNGALQKLEKVLDSYSKWYLTPDVERHGYNPRHTWQLLKSQYCKGPTLEIDSEPWSVMTLIAIGKFLYNILLRDIKIDINILKHNSKNKHHLPAFYTLFRRESKLWLEEVKPHPVLSRLYKGACSPHLYFSVTDLPMLSPPLPWNEPSSGGYLIARSPLIRLPHSAILQWERLKDRPANLLYPCLDSLNQLGSIPWKVNKPVLDTVIKLFNSGGHEKLGVPCVPPLTQSVAARATTKEEKYEAFRARMLAKRRRAEMYSLWCDALYRLSLANHFRDRIFWLPHNMDFRGRVYPCPPHLNHLGSDLYRALLVFAQSRPLGPEGLNWLKIHAINLTGLKKKESVRCRLDYANEILPKILDSAKEPFKKGAWWMESEKPWQTLATCFEIRNALNHRGGPESYPCSFPVHQDGSCNGLQHYAALGRDTSGAESVNLSPSDVPQDVYSCVAAIVDRERAKDAQNGVEIAQHLDGFIRRKVIKQTVMTTVYGVTRFGARLQIAKQLKDLEDFPKEHVWQGSHYLVHKTFYSIAEMFTSTREIQDWFTESARLISGIRGENVEYVTPLGLPVVQPYSKNANISAPSAAGSSGVVPHRVKQDMFERPNVVKQKNAFPPNFIHSLDSTHMMLTSLHCQRAGITFVSVHDCFWTHPDTVHIMNKICREQFVSLHSQPILQDLSEFLISKYGFDESIDCESHPEVVMKAMKKLNVILRAIPSTGDFQLENVLKSVYFFS
ncbi:DNA-directed RNA polymerase, mitochondrial [Halyomorpha halys]|uniref:DNA-directed RNA polymerase, mitochondrial n=1 Tax=Halyomorpha halys TaxID=286706 RepID=UPI0006D52495|nr:DNA-directed RNA polymerase, mitochondrial [Halyomorpha halys]